MNHTLPIHISLARLLASEFYELGEFYYPVRLSERAGGKGLMERERAQETLESVSALS